MYWKAYSNSNDYLNNLAEYKSTLYNTKERVFGLLTINMHMSGENIHEMSNEEIETYCNK